MRIEKIINNFNQFCHDEEISQDEIFGENNLEKLPSYMRETVRYLEEEMMNNPSFFSHIMIRLSREGFKAVHNPKDSTCTIYTSKGKILLM